MNEADEFDLIFQALASQPRRMILDLVKQKPACSVTDLCEYFDMSRIGVMKHIGILVDARLLISKKVGRTRQLFFNAAPIQLIYDRWTDEYSAFWATQAIDLKYALEMKQQQNSRQRPSVSKPKGSRQSVSKSGKSKKKGGRT